MTEDYFRPVRGAVRLNKFSWPTDVIKKEIGQIQKSDWKEREYGDRWYDVPLYFRGKNGAEELHPLLDQSPGLMSVLNGFPSRPLDMCIASLEAGGSVKEHRDISGGVAAGVIRFHIPIITHKDVAFFVSGDRVTMAEGELWTLDTTYKHRVINGSDVTRIHLIIDLEQSKELKAMLPPKDLRDTAHNIYFAGICVVKGIALLFTNPGMLFKRAGDFFRLRILRQSVLYESKES